MSFGLAISFFLCRSACSWRPSSPVWPPSWPTCWPASCTVRAQVSLNYLSPKSCKNLQRRLLACLWPWQNTSWQTDVNPDGRRNTLLHTRVSTSRKGRVRWGPPTTAKTIITHFLALLFNIVWQGYIFWLFRSPPPGGEGILSISKNRDEFEGGLEKREKKKKRKRVIKHTLIYLYEA